MKPSDVTASGEKAVADLRTKLHLTPPGYNRSSAPKEGQPDHFSNSQLQTYLRCGKQYEYKYILGFPAIGSLRMASGSALHETLEYNSRHKISHGVDMRLDDLIDVEATAHAKFTSHVEDAEPKEIGKDLDQSNAIVKLYRRTQAINIEPIAVEYPFSVDVEADEHMEYRPVIGYVDTYSQYPDPRPGPTQGKMIVALEDYKKVSQRKSQLEIDVHPQLTLYDYVFNLQTNMTTDVIGVRQLGFNGPRAAEPGPYSQPIYRSPEMMIPAKRQARWKRVIEQIKAVQRAIKAGIFIACDDHRVCSWCDYQTICQDKTVR